jgi:chromate reductase, NAD(P)H dehydrogenase (quinone)
MISSPEYAHGIPGVLKNALDWLVRSGELFEKPVALFSASPRATFAETSLKETLKAMTARLVSDASITVPLLGKNLDESGVISDSCMSHAIRSALVAFAQVIGLVEPSRDGRCS